jgi:hypothetical protein
MNARWTNMAADLLALASEEFSNHGCNDIRWPTDWTPDQRHEFLRAYNHWARTDYVTAASDYMPMPDSGVMEFLADQLRVRP